MNIIEELYLGNLDESSRTPSKEYKKLCEKELKLYNELKEKLPQEFIELYEKHINAMSESAENEAISRYIQGFKTGLLIAIECMKIEL